MSTVTCHCRITCKSLTVTKNNGNRGRKFFACKTCNFFQWGDGKPSAHDKKRSISSSTQGSSKQISASTSESYNLNTLAVYTDGACLGNSNVDNSLCPSGWGVVVVEDGGGVGKEDEGKSIAELYGPVVLDNSSPYFLGATKGSNNTAELSAIGEALIWCQQYALSSKPTNDPIPRILIRYDSDYAAKSVQRIFNGKKNAALISEIRKHYDALCNITEVSFAHVKGHSNAHWNDLADELAGKGASGQVCQEGRYKSKANGPDRDTLEDSKSIRAENSNPKTGKKRSRPECPPEGVLVSDGNVNKIRSVASNSKEDNDNIYLSSGESDTEILTNNMEGNAEGNTLIDISNESTDEDKS